MKRSKFTEAQIAFVLRQAEEGTAIGEVCRKAGISEATFYAWRKRYAGLMPSEMKRLRQLEQENGKLKKIVADHPDDRDSLQAIMAFARDAGDLATALDYAQRLARLAPNDPNVKALVESLQSKVDNPAAK